MEPIQAVEFRRETTTPGRTELDPAQLAGPRATNGKSSTAYFISEGDLTKFAASFPGACSDRGTKHPAKPLASYLRDRSGVLAIRAGYVNAGQAERGVRSLLSATAHHQVRAVFLIGVSAALLDQLWKRAAPSEEHSATSPHALHVGHDLKALLNHGSGEEVPPALRQAYLGLSGEAELVRRLIVRAASADHPVLILGETGTGKEVVARQIHQLSARAAETFVQVNCGGIPGELLESELFGHKKGAFTGATRNKPGLWTLASNGTLFLDEIGDLSLQHQVKILRALEDGRYRPVGGSEEITSRARIVAATNRDLPRMICAGLFREDLYYRLFAFPIRTPALREHPDDIPELAEHFWRKISSPRAQAFPTVVAHALRAYAWPGNARELRSFLINVFLLADNNPPDLPLIRAVMQDRLGQAVQIQADQ